MRTRTGRQLRRLRRKVGLTISGVCRLTGVPRSTWQKWENPPSSSDSRPPSELAFAFLNLYFFLQNCSDCPRAEFFLEDLHEILEYPEEYFEEEAPPAEIPDELLDEYFEGLDEDKKDFLDDDSRT